MTDSEFNSLLNMLDSKDRDIRALAFRMFWRDKFVKSKYKSWNLPFKVVRTEGDKSMFSFEIDKDQILQDYRN